MKPPKNKKYQLFLYLISALTGAHGAGNSGNINREQPILLHDRPHDQYMPAANIIRIMRRGLPPHAKIADEAKDTVQHCVSEFINFITSEANDRCHREQRKTVTAEDLLWAMARLGFEDYIEPLTLFLNRYREMESGRTSMHGEPLVKRTVDFGLPPGPTNYGLQPWPAGQAHGVFDAHEAMMMNGMNNYYRDNHGGGSSSSGQAAALPGFDPYVQFKRSL
ncbi:nuclear factor Y, subunit B6 [Actinidia rufa]|uniref:Nuclear factor Y, subunit B6 n=1 Tax=Actinidia rufa TaxID=165716 RepID=A0A7J0DDF8_9ERIC|nr:nuclear factor Y, subunit B6 [Actinidia rufa]